MFDLNNPSAGKQIHLALDKKEITWEEHQEMKKEWVANMKKIRDARETLVENEIRIVTHKKK